MVGEIFEKILSRTPQSFSFFSVEKLLNSQKILYSLHTYGNHRNAIDDDGGGEVGVEGGGDEIERLVEVEEGSDVLIVGQRAEEVQVGGAHSCWIGESIESRPQLSTENQDHNLGRKSREVFGRAEKS